MKTTAVLMLVIGFALVSSTGCYYDVEEELYPTVTCDTVDMTFSTNVMAILKSECLACHSTAAFSSIGGGINLDGYTNVKVYADNGKLLSSITHDGNASFMPKSASNRKLGSCQIMQITAWINQGTKNN